MFHHDLCHPLCSLSRSRQRAALYCSCIVLSLLLTIDCFSVHDLPNADVVFMTVVVRYI
jgi:hypothetical protein